MEASPRRQELYEERIERELNNLRTLSEVLGLPIIREEKLNGVISIVVDNGKGKEVHIGFPDGTHINGKKVSPAATDAIYVSGVKMGMYGHGIWRRSIDI
jgi:hypothetical protein